MSWIPARHVAQIVKGKAPQAAELLAHDEKTRGYLREFFEAIIRQRANDNRITKYADASELINCFEAMPSVEVFALLTALNASLAAADRRRNPPETHGTQQAWSQLVTTQAYAAVAADIATYAELVIEYASCLAELRASREVIEAAISLACHDARRDYLGEHERSLLNRLAKDDPALLLQGYAQVNGAIARLDLDQRVSFNPLAS